MTELPLPCSALMSQSRNHLRLTSEGCEAIGKQDATLWWLTSPDTPAILRGVGRSPGHTISQMASVRRLAAGPRCLEGLGQSERLQTLPITSSLVA